MSDRRTFLMSTGGLVLAHAAAPQASANDRVRVAVLGVNGRGKDHIAGYGNVPDAEVTMLCDPDKELLAKRAGEFEQRFGRKVMTEPDLRKVFERKDIDAVSIAMPNHWHSLAAIWACQAGKDVYVEKPGSHNVWEGRKMVEAAHRYSRIVQHGVQLRSSPALQEAVKLLNEGVIGKVYMARGLVFRSRPSIGKKPVENPPATLDYDLWLGPAQYRPFSRRFVHYNWHWHWDFGNGDVGNQGIHETDMCMWGLGVGLPSKITAMGGKFLFDDDKETPEVLTTLFHYPAQGKLIQFEVRPWYTNAEDGVSVGNIFYGSEGYMTVNGYHTYQVYQGPKKEKGPGRKEEGDHYANFIKAVRSRKTSDQNGPVETAHLSSALAHLGNIAYRLDRVLKFDPATERFPGDEQANRMLTRKYRAPYTISEKS
ncbi:MAG TPA: gfo/Idh/MocA family oxidoreductase [Solibacterales bacterium]|nr:gfo/Idh/MocA family oxidoreductase [Bryobacterales bacterium]